MPRTAINKTLRSQPKNTPDAKRALMNAMAKHIPDEDMSLFTPEIFADMVESHWALSRKRHDGKPQIAIYCPVTADHSIRKTVIDVVSDDMAFLVDTVAAEINKKNYLIDLLVHPILSVAYDSKGNLQDVLEKGAGKGYLHQSHIHVQIKETLSEDDLVGLEEGLYAALDDAARANADWKPMLTELERARKELASAKTGHPKKDIEKYCAFLDYLHNNNFTLLGFREYEFTDKDGVLASKTLKGRSLGILWDEKRPAYINQTTQSLPQGLQRLRKNLPPVWVSKTNRLSTVHRRVPMDAIAVKTYDSKGNVKGEKLFLGLLTSVTYSRSVSDVPYLREKVDEVVNMSDFLPGSHNRKALRHILERYPRDELFQIDTQNLYDTAIDILRLQERQRIALFMRQDPFGRYISCLVYIPRERFSTVLRKRIVKILEEELQGACSNFTTSMDEAVFARGLFIININQRHIPKYDPKDIEKKLQEAGQTWSEKLALALVENEDQKDRIADWTIRYGDAFPVSYTSRYRAKQAIFDITEIEETIRTGSVQSHIYRLDDLEPQNLRLKVFSPDKPLTLSDVMPILENMGLRAISELPFEIKPAKAVPESVWIHDFLLETSAHKKPIVVEDVQHNFEIMFAKTWYGQTENDALNRLVLSANMSWEEIRILRTYVGYLRQIRFPFSREYIQEALTGYPHIAGLLVRLFHLIHDPKIAAKSAKDVATCEAAIETALESVFLLDHDRTIRAITALIKATLRTNYFQRAENGEPKSYLSIKLDSAGIRDMPAPRPYREIFVYSPRVEGIHLRGDKIARGGIRWSDRHEDYRTEVLGLMKAQMVKNAVIVPMGSKGGFVVKSRTQTRPEFFKEGVECYKIFIRGLLDITDNLHGNKVIPPKDVVRRDGDDPYLVVAADKGTATFSDTANALSQEYGFWLDDAFASGGSAGYDHKKMGITARGAWECVKSHFQHLNHDIQKKPFDVTGVGDMGGDVFGNGMLLSDQIRLVGAFNHVHIFCDPNPDMAVSFKERKRLFDGVLGWDHYDTKKLSPGGRIFARSEKSLQLTPEIQKRFDIAESKVTPHDLIRAILKARTDLLFFGGIGTYVKASSETHEQVGDKSNDNLRINANELRAKVIGEGANMAVTQRARIQFSENGGRLNTDFLDNSGGVDSSDHEVNIKILLTQVMRSKNNTMDLKARNKLLAQMTDEVAAHVLRNNYQQTQAISLAELQARDTLSAQSELIQALEREQGLNRELEGLPSQDAIDERLRLGKGMTRPELCILLSYAKIKLTKELLASNIPDDPHMQSWLFDYFPDVLQKRYAKEIRSHRLAREIIATRLAGSIVNRLGPTFAQGCTKKTGASSADIARAGIVVRESFELRTLWDQIEALDAKAPKQVQLKAQEEATRMVEHTVIWFLTRLGRPVNMSNDIRDYKKGLQTLRKNLMQVMPDDMRKAIEKRAEYNVQDGLPKPLAMMIAQMPVLASACDIIRINLEEKADLLSAAAVYFRLGTQFHFDWLRQQARFMASEDNWHAEAKMGLIDQLYSVQAGLTVHILKDMAKRKAKIPSKNIADEWIKANHAKIDQLEPFFHEIRRAGTVDLPMLIAAEQRLRSLYAK